MKIQSPLSASASSTSMVVCASHAPLMYCHARPPAEHEQVEAAFAGLQEQIAEFDPELVFVFGPDHYTSLFRRLAPPFTIAARCEAVDDIGGHPGQLNVATHLAVECVSHLAEHGIDAAISYDFKVDHGISQTLHRITGAIGRYPTIPVIVNTMTPPLPPFHRSRLLGSTIGAFARGLNRRVLFLGSGGLSHNPKVIFPDYGTADAGVTSWQQQGPANTAMSSEAWYSRLTDIHHEAAAALASGGITVEDCRFNGEFDHKVIDILTSGTFSEMDHWDNPSIVENAGIGAVEVHTWLAACAAQVAAGGSLPICDLYAQTLEYGIAVGILHA
jgi:2,3-dihydroxyphenylpropionate 1,2-dioxygenase